MAEGPNDWERRVGRATHEWNAAEIPVFAGPGAEGQGEAPTGGDQGAEPRVTKPAPESPAAAEYLIEEVCERENLERAWKQVRRNKGVSGGDKLCAARMSVLG